jgi:hypothetical protein
MAKRADQTATNEQTEAESNDQTEAESDGEAATKPSERARDAGTTMIELAVRPDGTWEATQAGLEIVGTGDSAARATEDLAGQIADSKEAGDL